jgi:hypothetical protein
MCLKRKPEYKKRVTWIETIAKGMNITCTDKAVVEYLGEFPTTVSMHGNSKKGSRSEYVRTSESVKSDIKDKVKNDQPRNVYSEMVLDNSMEAPPSRREYIPRIPSRREYIPLIEKILLMMCRH